MEAVSLVQDPEVFPSLVAILQVCQIRFREATNQGAAQVGEVVSLTGSSVGVVEAEVEEGTSVVDLTAEAEDRECIAAFDCP